MAFNEPTLQDLDSRVKGDIREGLSLRAILRRTFLFPLARALAALSFGLHKRASFIAQQLFVDQMEAEFLDRFGAIYNLPRAQATFTQLSVRFTGDPGSVIAVNEEMTRDDGQTYDSNAEVTIQTAVSAVQQVFTVDTIADVSQSLNSTYFLFSSPDVDYYAWIDVAGNGVDPSISTRTGVQVTIDENATADEVATALRAAIDLQADMNATVSLNTVTVTCQNGGASDDPTDSSTPTGFTFLVTTNGVDAVVGGEVEGVITANTAGEITNTDAGNFLTLSTAITGVDSEVEVIGTVVEGDDRESDDSYRARILNRLREAPHGGNVNDYIQWARTITGVTRAWVTYNVDGPGSLGVSFVEDGEADIFPDAAKITEVQEYIDSQKPVTARPIVFAPVEAAINPIIAIKPNTSAVRAAVETELKDLIFRDAAPKNAIKDASTGELYDGTILLSRIREAISIAQGEEDNRVIFPTTDFVVTDGQMATLGEIQWQAL